MRVGKQSSGAGGSRGDGSQPTSGKEQESGRKPGGKEKQGSIVILLQGVSVAKGSQGDKRQPVDVGAQGSGARSSQGDGRQLVGVACVRAQGSGTHF